MTAQIRPNRMEVSDRFPMLGFAVRAEEPNVEAEVVLATDIGLFQPQNRTSRTAANFYSSRETGVLSVPRGDGIFVVPPEVLARFIGNDKLYFGLATGRTGNGGLKVDALPREGSPYVSLRGFTGRTLRRSFGDGRPSGPPMLQWTGDAAQPGGEPSNGASVKAGTNGNGRANGNGLTNGNGHASGNGATVPAANGNGTQATAPGGSYDDGFGPMPEIPAREAGYSGRGRPQQRFGLQMSEGMTAQAALEWIRVKIEQAVGVMGSDVTPPSLYALGANSGAFRTAWQAANAAAGLFSPLNAFFADLPSLADRSGVTISIGPALDTPLFGGGVGVVFEPGGQVALFGSGEFTMDPSGIQEFVSSLKLALQAKLKLGYNSGGIAAFGNLGTVAGVAVGEEIVVGAEVWLDRQGYGIGGAVSIGVGFALQLAAQDAERRRPSQPARAMATSARRRYGLQMGGGLTAEAAFAWLRSQIEQAVATLGSDVDPPYVYRLASNSELFRSVWQTAMGATSLVSPTNAFLYALPGLADQLGVTFSIGPALDTPFFGGGVGVVFEPGGQVALFGAGEISADLGGIQEFLSSLKLALQAKLKLGYNAGGIAAFANIGKVAAVNVGEELVVGAEIWLDRQGVGIGGAASIGVGFALQLAAQEAERQRAERIGGQFAPQLGRALDLELDPRKLEPLLDVLDPPPAAQAMRRATTMRAPVRGLGAGAWTINWDDIELVPQPTDVSCWAAAAAMIVGWRDWVSLSPETLASICSRAVAHGLIPADVEAFAADIGLESEPPMSYAPEGFRRLIEANGPLWVSKRAGGNGHAVVVTGMYSDGTNHFVRVADPWDRAVGTPGSPGGYAATHVTGSRYIMRYEDFHQEYELFITGSPPNRQILHAGGTHGHTLNTGQTAPPPGYAMAAEPAAANLSPAPAPRARAMDGGAAAAIAIGGFIVETIRDSQGDVTWELDQFRGIKHPGDVAPATPAPFRDGATIRLDEWPVAGGVADDISAWFKVDWQHNGTSLGNVRITNIGTNNSIGWGLHVRAQIMDDNQIYPPSNCGALRVTFHYRFSRTIGSDVIAIREIKLYGDGTWETSGDWVQASALSVRRGSFQPLHA